MKSKALCSSILVIGTLFSANANAGVYSDDLSRCLVESSTSEDKLVLVRWMFTAMALHPAVKSIAPVSEQQNNEATKEVADLIQTLVTKTCKEQAVKAVKYEGSLALQSSFEVFGKVAATELFSHPDVAVGMSKLENYMDAESIQKELGIKK